MRESAPRIWYAGIALADLSSWPACQTAVRAFYWTTRSGVSCMRNGPLLHRIFLQIVISRRDRRLDISGRSGVGRSR